MMFWYSDVFLYDGAISSGAFADAATQAKLADQSRVLAGETCQLWAVSATDGAKLAEYDLPTQPVWDGMAAAPDRLYIALKNGYVVCLEGRL